MEYSTSRTLSPLASRLIHEQDCVSARGGAGAGEGWDAEQAAQAAQGASPKWLGGPARGRRGCAYEPLLQAPPALPMMHAGSPAPSFHFRPIVPRQAVRVVREQQRRQKNWSSALRRTSEQFLGSRSSYSCMLAIGMSAAQGGGGTSLTDVGAAAACRGLAGCDSRRGAGQGRGSQVLTWNASKPGPTAGSGGGRGVELGKRGASKGAERRLAPRLQPLRRPA